MGNRKGPNLPYVGEKGGEKRGKGRGEKCATRWRESTADTTCTSSVQLTEIIHKVVLLF